MDLDYKEKLNEVSAWLQKEYQGIRGGQATPAFLDAVRVESYGSVQQLRHIGSVGIEDARTLRVSPWDAGQVTAVEKAIRDADLGVSVVADSSGLRVIFPELTGERRAQILKLAKQKLEEARISVRGVRDEAMKTIEAATKAGDISEDERNRERDNVQKAVDAANQSLESHFSKKEVEING